MKQLRRRSKRAILVPLCCLPLLAGLAWGSGCQRKASDAAAGKDSPGPTHVEAVRVAAHDIDHTITLSATAEGFENVQLMARVEGYVDRVNVDIGDEVDEGDALAVLNVPELEADVAERETRVKQADADLASQKAELEQVKALRIELEAKQRLQEAKHRQISNLVESGALQQEMLDEARYALEAALAAVDTNQAKIRTAEARVQSAEAQIGVAQAALDRATTMLDFATIRAPFTGVVTRRMVDRGAFVRPAVAASGATPLFTITRVDKLRLVVWLPMEAAGKLDERDPATLHGIQGRPGERVDGSVARHALAFNEGSRMMRAEIDLDNPAAGTNGRRRFEPGMYGTVTVTLETSPGAPTVPATALGTDAEGDYVMVIAEGKARRRPVTVTFKNAMIAALGEGVKIGDIVASKDPGRLKDGQPVAAKVAEVAQTP